MWLVGQNTFCGECQLVKESASVIGTACLAVTLTPWPASGLSFLLLPLQIRGISFLLKAPRQLLFPENRAFKFPHVQPEGGACCGNQPCRIQPASNASSSVTSPVISSVHLVTQLYPTLPPSSSPWGLSDRLLPYILSPWRGLKARHRCITHCKHCLDVLHFIVWNPSLGHEALQDPAIKENEWAQCLSSLLTCSGLPGTFTSPPALLICLASYVWNDL